MSRCLHQGAIVGGTLSTLFSVWMVIGNFLYDPHRQSLPTSIDKCYNITEADNFRWNSSYSVSGVFDFNSTTSFHDVTTASSPVE
jgi:hypothetical protein